MTKTMYQNGLLRFHVLSLWAFVAACLLHFAYPAREDYPCPDTSAIQWVRHKNDCSRYYICHFGHPLVMPRCPVGQVWGNLAKNCVPEGSRWDDCNQPSVTTPRKNTSRDHSRSLYPYSSGSPYVTSQPVVTYVTPRASRPKEEVIKPTSPTTIEVRVHEKTTSQWHSTKKLKTPGKSVQHVLSVDPPKQLPKKPLVKSSDKQIVKKQSTDSKSQMKIIKSPYLPPTKRTYATAPTARPSKSVPTAPTTIPTRLSSPMTSTVITTPKTRPTHSTKTLDHKTYSSPSTSAPTRRIYPTFTTIYPTKKTVRSTPPTPTSRRSHPTPLSLTTTRRAEITTASTPITTPGMKMDAPPDHPCLTSSQMLLPHPKNCHWYYNCSMVQPASRWLKHEPFTEECRYPQLFDEVTMTCREFINVNCMDKFEPVDPCEYTENQCASSSCIPCHYRYGSCRGKQNGIYPFHEDRWTPTFVTCFDQRNIAQDDCQEPNPIFSPKRMDCVSLFEVPKVHGGLGPDCSFRSDGFYPDEQGRCGIFFQCRDGEFVGFDECPAGKVFDPLSLGCEEPHLAAPPCGKGQVPHCEDRADGYHADPFGRCTYYFECRRQQFVKYLTCDFGSFDPVHQRCVIPTELIPRPCGLLPNPCEKKASGFYPNTNNGCRDYIECSRGILISNGTCPDGLVFSIVSGRCDRPENAPPPCGLSPSCENKKDGKYSALLKGCSYYYECSNKVFQGFKQCTYADGGFFFNEKKGECDLPQNICPPCGYRWWGCSGTNMHG